MDRRTLLKGAAAGVGLVATSGARALARGTANIALPSNGLVLRPARTPVEHLVVVMMENRSLDHYLGWYGRENRDFDGVQDASFPDLRQGPDGPMVATKPWGVRGGGNYHGRGWADPSHGWSGGRYERAGGDCDGWLDPRTGNDEFCLSTYDALDLPAWAQLVRGWQSYDRWHASLLGPTQPNRYYMHSGQSAGFKSNDLPPEVAQDHPQWAAGWDWPTVWTLFEQYGMTSSYYFSNLPELAFWGPRHLSHCRHVSNYFADALAGTLPQVSFIDPFFINEPGPGNDDHPHADVRLGQQFLSDVVEAFTMSPCYQKGALVVTYDEWGGFWDHVPPPRVRDDRATDRDPGGDDDFGQLGFRIPSSIVSPWTRGERVDHSTYEHGSTVKFIADNWNLPYLTQRVRFTNSIERAFRRFRSFDPAPNWVPYQAPAVLWAEPLLEEAGVDPVAEGDDREFKRAADMGWFDGLGIDVDHRFEDGFLRPSNITAMLQQVAQVAVTTL